MWWGLQAIIRWSLFLTIGIIFQLIFVPIYVFIYIYYLLFIRKTYKNQDICSDHYVIEMSDSRIPKFDTTKQILINDDNHNMLTQYTIAIPISFYNFIFVDSDGFFNFSRDSKGNSEEVSGDCVISFCFAAILNDNYKDKIVQFLIKKLAKTYLIFLGTRSFDKKNKGFVSNRCNNFGVNFCPDSELFLGQPMFGPQFYTSSCLFALASYKSFFWKLVFWIHWIFMGGWFWAFMPGIFLEDRWWYVKDMMMKSLFVHKIIFGNKWWIRLPMQIINKTNQYKNPLFCAMLKIPFPYDSLPNFMSRFWSQNKWGISQNDSVYVPNVSLTLKEISKL